MPNDTVILDEGQLLSQCQKYASLYAELMELSGRLKAVMKDRGPFVFAHNYTHYKLHEGVYSEKPLELIEHDVLSGTPTLDRSR